jgi:hypothetical protein
MLKRTLTLLVLSILFNSPICKSQITMNLMPPPPYGVSLKNLLDPVIVNNQKSGYRVYLIGTINDVNGKELANFRTNFFNIGTGITNVNYEQVGLMNQNFLDYEFQSSYERTRYFPIGEFNLCVHLIQYESDKVLAQSCVPTRVLPLQPPRLVFPMDSAKIKIPDPIFSWLPVIGGGSSQEAIKYELTVKEILQGQSAAEAITSNPELLVANNIPNTFYPYPSTSLNTLNYGQDYVWQVKAYAGDYFIGQSEIWVFKLVMDSIKIKKTDSSYSVPALFLDGGIHYAIGSLRFKYDGEYTSRQLSFKIYDDKLNEINIRHQKLWQNYGDNRYSIDLTEVKGIKNNNYYLLVITNEKGLRYFLRFEYKKKKM